MYCTYSHNTEATKECEQCKVPLCNPCGFIYNNADLCNACYSDTRKEEALENMKATSILMQSDLQTMQEEYDTMMDAMENGEPFDVSVWHWYYHNWRNNLAKWKQNFNTYMNYAENLS